MARDFLARSSDDGYPTIAPVRMGTKRSSVTTRSTAGPSQVFEDLAAARSIGSSTVTHPLAPSGR